MRHPAGLYLQQDVAHRFAETQWNRPPVQVVHVLLMVDPQTSEDRRRQVVWRDGKRVGVTAAFGARAVNYPRLHSASRQADRLAESPVVPAVLPIDLRRAAEFAVPGDQRLIKQSPTGHNVEAC